MSTINSEAPKHIKLTSRFQVSRPTKATTKVVSSTKGSSAKCFTNMHRFQPNERFKIRLFFIIMKEKKLLYGDGDNDIQEHVPLEK
jgi:hypothetical protein